MFFNNDGTDFLTKLQPKSKVALVLQYGTLKYILTNAIMSQRSIAILTAANKGSIGVSADLLTWSKSSVGIAFIYV